MRNMWKMGILALGGIVMLSGCAAKAAGAGGEKTDASGRTEVTLWYSGGKTAAGVMEEMVQEFNASQEQYTVAGVVQADYDETYQKLQAGIASKTAADLALMDADKAYSLAAKGLLEDIRPLAEADETFAEDQYLEVFYKQGVKEDGALFALPAYGTTQVMYYNRAVFEKAGIVPEEIKTWQDLEQIAGKLAASGQEDVFAWEPMWNEDNLIDAAFSNGAKFFSEDGTTVTINSQEWVDAWESFGKWIHEDKIMRIHYGGQGWEYWYSTMDDAVNGLAAGYTGSSGDQADLDFSIVGAMEQPGFGSHPSAPVARALQFVMPGSDRTEAKAGAYAFMRFFGSPENQAKWSMATGYVPVQKATLEDETYQAYTEENPHALVPFTQASHGSILPIDPTGGKIYDALAIAADQVEIEHITAKQALDDAQKTAQKALDAVLKGK